MFGFGFCQLLQNLVFSKVMVPPWCILNGGTVPPFNLFKKKMGNPSRKMNNFFTTFFMSKSYHINKMRMFPKRKRLNGGTVPPFKMHHGGTVPPSKMHHGGTVPPYKMHRGGTVPPFKMHHGGTMTFEKTTFWSNLQNPKTTTTQPYFN